MEDYNDIEQKFEDISLQKDYFFDYGPSHWLNLNDFEDDTDKDWVDRKKILLLHWVDDEDILNEYGAVEETEYSGEFTLSVRSRLSDGSYIFKYKEYIRKLRLIVKTVFNSFDGCSGLTVKKWRRTQVVNQYDTNLDGIKVSFTITKSEI